MRPPLAAPSPGPLPGSLRAAPLAQGFAREGLEGVGRGLTAGLVGAAHPTRNCALVTKYEKPRHRPICTLVAALRRFVLFYHRKAAPWPRSTSAGGTPVRPSSSPAPPTSSPANASSGRPGQATANG